MWYEIFCDDDINGLYSISFYHDNENLSLNDAVKYALNNGIMEDYEGHFVKSYTMMPAMIEMVA